MHQYVASSLPDWAKKMIPIDVQQATEVLGVGERKLRAIIADYPYYEKRGKKIMFYPEHITALRAVALEAQKPKPTKPKTRDREAALKAFRSLRATSLPN